MGRRRSVASGFLLVCSACSVIIDAEPKQCSSDEECRARGGQFASSECNDGYCSVIEETVTTEPEEDQCSKDTECDVSETCLDKKCQSRWDCVGESTAEPASGEIALEVHSASSLGDILPNLPAKICRNIDPPCDNPIAEVVSDEQGVFHLNLPEGFTGYMEVVVEGFFPQLYYFPPELTSETPLPNLSLSPVQLIQGLGAYVGAQPNPERGHIFLTLRSCLGIAPGVRLEATKADDLTIPYYVIDGLPSADAEETTMSGTAGFLNFPPGNTVVKLMSGTAGDIGSLSLTVRPGYITSVTYNPASLSLSPQ